MITKTAGVIKTVPMIGWYQDYKPDPNNPSEWVPYGGKYTYNVNHKNGCLSTITYDNTPIKRGGFKRTKYCHHTVQTVESSIVHEGHFMGKTSSIRRDSICPGSGSEFSHTLPNLSAYHIDALNFFKSGCTEKEFSLAVNLLEMKEIPRLFTEIPKIVRNLTSSRKAYLGTANAHLWYSFGLKPLVSDIKALVSVVRKLHDRIVWFRKNEGSPVRVRFSKDLSQALCPAPIKGSDVSGTWATRTTSFRARYQAHATVRYRTELLSDLELKTRTLVRAFGLDNPIEWAWERIPYSFVIDWFLKVGNFIENIGPHITIPCDIIDCGWAIKIEETRDFTAWRYKPYHTSSEMRYWQASTKTYHREPGLPVSFSMVTNDPGLSQLALGISLFIQRMK